MEQTTANRKHRAQVAMNRQEALRHPVRAAALEYLNTHGVCSPTQIAKAIEEDVSNVSHHVKRLVKLGCAEPVRERQVRGATEHFYRAIEPHLLTADDFAALPEEARKVNVMQCADLAFGDFTGALHDGTLTSDEQICVWRAPMPNMDRQSLVEAVGIMEDAIQQIEALKEPAMERLNENGEEPIAFSYSLFAFEVERFATVSGLPETPPVLDS